MICQAGERDGALIGVTVVEINVAQILVPAYAAFGSKCEGYSSMRRVVDILTCHGR